jgi:hypothetical protein
MHLPLRRVSNRRVLFPPIAFTLLAERGGVLPLAEQYKKTGDRYTKALKARNFDPGRVES